jgi:hypothetical protein
MFVGIDLFRSLPTYFQSGYTVEPSLIYKTRRSLLLDLAGGYTNITDKIYRNIDYSNAGTYLRLGIRKSIGSDFDMGASVGFSSFTENGNVLIAGSTFGDYTIERSQSNEAIFVQPEIGYKVDLSPKFSMLFQFRTIFILNRLNEEEFPVYAAPGIGYLQFFSANNTSSPATLGFSARLLYKIFNKE